MVKDEGGAAHGRGVVGHQRPPVGVDVVEVKVALKLQYSSFGFKVRSHFHILRHLTMTAFHGIQSTYSRNPEYLLYL